MMWRHKSVRSQQTAKVNAAISASEAAYNRRDYVNAVNILSGMAALATSGAQKAGVYQGQAQASSAQDKLTEALQYYDLKHKADASTVKADAYTVGGIYQRLGQKDKALEQYKIALAYARTQNNQYGSDVDAIQANIDELEQSK
jgi:tetratricopeptide (TPR) repeat protein